MGEAKTGVSKEARGGVGIVLSGGGSRTAYQVGALKALASELSRPENRPKVIVGSSIGAINGIILGDSMVVGIAAGVDALRSLWRERTYRNTFHGSPSRALLRALQITILRYSSPGPAATSLAIFNPTPLRDRIDGVLKEFRAMPPSDVGRRAETVAIMATVEAKKRRPLLFCSREEPLDEEYLKGASFSISYVPMLSAAHGLASAALPSVLPPVQLNADSAEVRLVDGGICDNIPVDPAVRLGADRLIVIDASGRRWWFDHYGEPHDTRPTWEVVANEETYCYYPRKNLELMTKKPLGELLKQSTGRSRVDLIAALGPTWPIFRILKHKMGEALAYEVMSYVALHPGYFEAVEELGFQETQELLKTSDFFSVR